MSIYPAAGKRLTEVAFTIFGVKRKVWFWIFKESDTSLRKRCRKALRYDL